MTPLMYAVGLWGGYLEGWVLERWPSVDGACGSITVLTEAIRLLSASVSSATALSVGSLSPRGGAGYLLRGGTLVSRRSQRHAGCGGGSPVSGVCGQAGEMGCPMTMCQTAWSVNLVIEY